MATMSPEESEGQYRGALPWAIGMQDIATGFDHKHSCMRTLLWPWFRSRKNLPEVLATSVFRWGNINVNLWNRRLNPSVMILRLVLQSQGYFYVSELCILCKAHCTSQVAQIMSARADPGMQLHLQILDKLRQEMGTQSLWSSAQAEFKPLRKTGELTASPRAKQTHRMWLRGCWIPLLRIQC